MQRSCRFRIKRHVWFFCIMGSLVGCGQNGDLYLPTPPLPEPSKTVEPAVSSDPISSQQHTES